MFVTPPCTAPFRVTANCCGLEAPEWNPRIKVLQTSPEDFAQLIPDWFRLHFSGLGGRFAKASKAL